MLFVSDQTRCNVWILDGDLYHKGLLKFAMEASSLKDTLVMLVVDMSKPWTALDSLQKWASVVREHIDKLKILPEEMQGMELKSKCCWESHLTSLCANVLSPQEIVVESFPVIIIKSHAAKVSEMTMSVPSSWLTLVIYQFYEFCN